MSAFDPQNMIANEIVRIVRRDHRPIYERLVIDVLDRFIVLDRFLTGWLAIYENVLRRLGVIVTRSTPVHIDHRRLIEEIITPIVVRVVWILNNHF